MPVLRFSPAQIRRYYDRNTSAFVALGQGGSVGAIHRAVWGPGVTRSEDAFHYVEDRIAEHIRRLPLDVDIAARRRSRLRRRREPCYLAGEAAEHHAARASR